MPKRTQAKTFNQIEAAADSLIGACDPTENQCLMVLTNKDGNVTIHLKGNIESLFTALVLGIKETPEVMKQLEHYFTK